MPAASRATNSPARVPAGTKQISWLSSLSAVGRFARRACSRTCALVRLADRKPRRRELLGRQVPQEVGLVLGRVETLAEHPAARRRVRLGPHVVSRRDRVAGEPSGAFPERRELDLGVARGARDRRLPGQIGGDEGAHDVAAELLLEVEHVVADSQRPGDAARVGQIVQRAASAGAAGLARVIPELHREADDLVALLLQEKRGDRGIDPARHGDGDAHGGTLSAIGQAGVTISIRVDPPTRELALILERGLADRLITDEGSVRRAQVEQQDVLAPHLDGGMVAR